MSKTLHSWEKELPVLTDFH